MAAYTKEQNDFVRQIQILTAEELVGKLDPNESLYLRQLETRAKQENLCWW